MRPSQFFYRILIAVSSECILRIGVCVSIFEKRARIFFKAVLDVEDCAREIIVVWDECVFFGFVDLLELSHTSLLSSSYPEAAEAGVNSCL